MSRRQHFPLKRLARKVWIRALRLDLHQSLQAQGASRGITTWSGLERKLLAAHDEAAIAGRLQGILGVVHHGNDPRRLVRRVRDDDLAGHIPAGGRRVVRKASGRGPPDGPREKHVYWEIPVDLVAAGEALCPGSSDWENAYLWRLALPILPQLEDLRSAITELKREIGLVSPSLDEYRHHLASDEFEAIAHRPHDEQVKRYVAAMKPLTSCPTANGLSLLGALVAESYITDQDLLLNLHRDAFYRGTKNLLADSLMADIAEEFEREVAGTILAGMWQFPATYHVSSLAEPFVSLKVWERIVREGNSWIGIRPASFR